jgi:hypothetical protein
MSILAELIRTKHEVSGASPAPFASLYPSLSLLHNPEDFNFEPALTANNAKRFKADTPEAGPTPRNLGRTGKRAEGRALITAKWESAKELAEAAERSGSGTPLSVRSQIMEE